MKKPKANASPTKFSREEVVDFCYSTGLASRYMAPATQSVAETYSLGPRGAWILGLISTGVVFPSDLADVFGVGRSLITAELTRLTEAGLVTRRVIPEDGRRFQLALTTLGIQAYEKMLNELTALVNDRLSSYSRKDIARFVRILHDFGVRIPKSLM